MKIKDNAQIIEIELSLAESDELTSQADSIGLTATEYAAFIFKQHISEEEPLT